MWTYFLLKEEGKERIKVSSIFVTDMTGNLVEHTFSSLRSADAFPVVAFGGREATTGNASALRRLTFSCLTDILFRTSHMDN